MKVTAWNNGSPSETGTGYGIKIDHVDRDRYFKEEWDSAIIDLENGKRIEVNISEGFWRGCCELRSAEIGRWFIEHCLAPWPKRYPPKMELQPLEERTFLLKIPE